MKAFRRPGARRHFKASFNPRAGRVTRIAMQWCRIPMDKTLISAGDKTAE